MFEFNQHMVGFSQFNKMNESSNEMSQTLYFSPILREQLKKLSKYSGIVGEIAQKMINLEGDNVTNITLLDLGKNGYLSFTTMEKALKLIHDKDRHFVLTSAGDSDWFWMEDDKDSENSTKIWKQGRNQIKVGKVINKLFNNKFSPRQIEEFTNQLKASIEESSIEIKLVSGKEIDYWYNQENYKIKPHEYGSGTLGNSCMADRKGIFKLYTENPDVCRMLIMTMNGKLVARALVWKLNTIEGRSDIPDIKYFMDRIYSHQDYLVPKMQNYATEQGWAFKGPHGHYLTRIFYRKEISPYSIQTSEYYVNMTVKVKIMDYGTFPYMDTFKRYDFKRGILYNDESMTTRGYRLNSTYGEFTKNKIGIVRKFKDFLTQK